jgi:hydrogenase expression/formation protein HypC
MGIPMMVTEGNEFAALCRRRGENRKVAMLLVGAQPAGSYVLVHLDTAIRVLDGDEAKRIDDALDGVAAAMQGRAFEHLFADLIAHEPQLPQSTIEPEITRR